MTGAHGIGFVQQARFACAATVFVALAGLASPVEASFGGGGGISIPAWALFFIGGIFATPGALAVATIEWIGARRHPPAWVAIVPMVLAILALAIAAGYGGKSDSGWYLLPVPPLLMLALVALCPQAKVRLAATWLVSLLAFALAIYGNVRFGSSSRSSEVHALVAGGACATILLWQLTWWLRQAHLARQDAKVSAQSPDAGGPPAASGDAAASGRGAASVVAEAVPRDAAGAPLPYEIEALRRGAEAARSRIRSTHPGLLWWLLGTVVFYVGIGAASAAGFDALLEAMRRLEWQVLDFFGWPTRSLEGSPLRMWAAHGLAWSALFGCGTWGAAAVAGRFDPGPLQALRFAGVAACAIMLLAVAMTASQIRI